MSARELSGLTAFVTGSGRGIGRGIALALAMEVFYRPLRTTTPTMSGASPSRRRRWWTDAPTASDRSTYW
mgnify:CR=1 FL=1